MTLSRRLFSLLVLTFLFVFSSYLNFRTVQLSHEFDGGDISNPQTISLKQKPPAIVAPAHDKHSYSELKNKALHKIVSPNDSGDKKFQVEVETTLDMLQNSLTTSPNTKYIVPPVLRPCGPQQSFNEHLADRNHWQSLKPDLMASKRQEWKTFLIHSVPKLNYESFNFRGKGVVYTASGYTLARAIASANLLRKWNSQLPIQIWYIESELSGDQLRILSDLDIDAFDIINEQKKYPGLEDFRIGHAYGTSRNYHIKSLVLILSSFEEVLYLDSDNMPLRNPDFMFSRAEYLETGAVFWRDFWKFPGDHPLWQITEQPCEDEWEHETGQIVLNKRKAWRGLLLSMFFQKDHEFYFKIMLGDKDTFRFAWKATGTPYHLIQMPVGIGGRIRQGKFCGHTMLQPGPDGVFLFAHTNAMKGTNAIRLGNTWEMVQYLIPSPPRLVATENDEHSYRVSYPQAFEYAGGIEKTPEEGGVGDETNTNPCLNYGLKDMVVETTETTVRELGVENAVDSFKIVTETFSGYHDGVFEFFEDSYYESGGLGSRSDATCGNGRRGNGICAQEGECCSNWGWCGVTTDHCGVGCRGGPCFKSRIAPENPSSNFEWCGDGKVGFGICKNSNECCSKFGWCGADSNLCAATNCLSGSCEAAVIV